jgi:acetyl esterase/lipase
MSFGDAQTSWWLLAVGFIAAGLLLNALRPVRRPAAFAVLSFFAGWLTSEAPLHLLVLEGLACAGLIAAGGLHHRIGWTGLGLCLLSWPGLWFLYRHGDKAKVLAETVLRHTLGADYGARLAGLSEVDASLPPGRLVLPLWLTDPSVRVGRDIRYAPDAGRRHCLDVYRPRVGTGPAPVLFQIHGGGWAIGHKAQQARPLLYYMAARGWVCVAPNYRLSPRVRWPDHLVDLKLALCWVREHIGEYGGDPGFVVVTGGSAGAHLAAMMALTANDPTYQPGFEGADTRVQGAVPFYGVYDLLDRHGLQRHGGLRPYLERVVLQAPYRSAREMYERASPLSHVHDDAPPFLVVHGRNDSLASVDEARLFAERLRAVSHQPVGYLELPYAQHAFDLFYSPRTLHVIRAVHRFASAVYADRTRCRRG